MLRNFESYLMDIYRAGEDILFYTAGFNLDMFESVSLVQAGVERKFEIIGEAITRCKHHYPDQVHQIGDIGPIVAFRNELVHRYDTVKSEIIWDILQNDLPPLMERVKQLMDAAQARNSQP